MKQKHLNTPSVAVTSAISSLGKAFYPKMKVLALKRVVSLHLQQILEQDHVTKTELASRMKTSRASLDRMLDPSKPSLTVASLGKAVAALGRKVELRFVPA